MDREGTTRLGAMRKVLCLAVLLALSMALGTGARAAGLRVGIIGDQTWSRDLTASYRTMEQGIAFLMQEKVDMIVHTGDMVESSLDEPSIRRDFGRASALLGKAGVPWYGAAGDHDVNPPGYAPDSPDRSRERLFLSLLGKHIPLKDHLYYSFDRGAYHFVVLHSAEHLHTDPRWGNVFLSRIGDRQYEWLRRDLAAHRNSKGIVLFTHHPLWYNRAGWARVHRLLREHPVIAVVAGHFHYNQDEGTLDGIRYLVVGATGAETKRADPGAGGVHHVTLMTLQGRKAVFRPLAVSPHGAMSFTSRDDMDRVQALDCAQGQAGDKEPHRALFVKEGVGLVGDCAVDSPARITLGPLGNPLDVPLSVTVRVRSTSSPVEVASSAFDSDACTASDSRLCVMKPGYGVVTASTSSVVIDRKARPLWEGVLRAGGKKGPAEGQKVSLLAEMSFRGTGGRTLRLFYETPEIRIQACPAVVTGAAWK